MARRGDPSVLRMVVIFLRSHANLTQAQFGREAKVDQSDVSRYELGHQAPSESTLRRMAKVADIDWPLVLHLRQYYSSFITAAAKHKRPPTPGVLDIEILEPVLLAVVPYLSAVTSKPNRLSPEGERCEADRIWTALETYPLRFRRRLIELSPRSGSWALAVTVCEASVKKAPHNPTESLQLAELALSIAERATGTDGWRSRLMSYCWAHIANARRTSNDFSGSEEAFARAWDLWRAGVDSEPGLLAEWVLPSMEASLRRLQSRFPEAMLLLEQASSFVGGSSAAAQVYLLLQKENIAHQMGDIEGALAALSQAAPFVEAAGDLRKVFALRFNMADDLCSLERFAEADILLPEVRAIAQQQASDLDLIRVAWLTAKVAAGKGQAEEAIATLEQVYKEFTARELAFDAALSSLDLAMLLLKERRSEEVREMATAMGWIFKAKGLDRKALMALKLFCDAALQANATVELVRKVVTELECVRRRGS